MSRKRKGVDTSLIGQDLTTIAAQQVAQIMEVFLLSIEILLSKNFQGFREQHLEAHFIPPTELTLTEVIEEHTLGDIESGLKVRALLYTG